MKEILLIVNCLTVVLRMCCVVTQDCDNRWSVSVSPCRVLALAHAWRASINKLKNDNEKCLENVDNFK